MKAIELKQIIDIDLHPGETIFRYSQVHFSLNKKTRLFYAFGLLIRG